MYGSVFVRITLPLALSPQTTFTGDMSRVDETHTPLRVDVFASAILRSGDQPNARQEPHLFCPFFASVHRRSTPFLTYSGAGCSSIRALPRHHHCAPPSPFTSPIARYPTSKAPRSSEALRPIARSEMGFDALSSSPKHTRERWDAAALVRCCALVNGVSLFYACHHHPPPFPRILVIFLGFGSHFSGVGHLLLGGAASFVFIWLCTSLFTAGGSVHTYALPDAAPLFIARVSRLESLSVTMSLLTLVSSHHISSHLIYLHCICAVPS